jgi:multiple sugar transport system substrate-binding protein
MRNLKKVLCFTLIISMVMSAVIAGGKKEEAVASGPITLKWVLWDLDATTYYKPLIEAYQLKNPNVKIETLDLGSTDYMTMVKTQLTGGDDTIDVVTVKDIPGYNNLVKSGLLLGLNDYIKSSKIDTSVYGGIPEQITVANNVYALPFRSDFWIVYYNKALFDKAGVAYPTNDMTLKQYDALARKMTSGTGANKVYGSHYHTWRSAVQLFGILEGKQTIVDGKYEFLKPYYELILNEQKDGICQDYATLKTSSTHYSGVFYNNSVAMMNMGSWFISTQIAKVKSGESKSTNWGIVKYPHPDGVKAGTTLGTITTLGVSAASKKQEAALAFMKFVTGAEGAEIIAKTGTIPAIKNDTVVGIISQMPGFPTDANSKEALKTYKTYLEMPLHPKAAEIEVVLNQNHDNIMTNNISVDEAIAKMNKDVTKILGN